MFAIIVAHDNFEAHVIVTVWCITTFGTGTIWYGTLTAALAPHRCLLTIVGQSELSSEELLHIKKINIASDFQIWLQRSFLKFENETFVSIRIDEVYL